MQHKIFTKMRSLKMIEGCKGPPVHTYNPSVDAGGGAGEKLRHHINEHLKGQVPRHKSVRGYSPSSNLNSEAAATVSDGALLPYGLPATKLLEPKIEATLTPLDYVVTLADLHRRLENSAEFEKAEVFLEQFAVFRGLPEPKLFRRTLRSARKHAVDVHAKVVLSSWLRYERREDELTGISSMDCCGRNLECPKANLVAGYDPESVYEPCFCSKQNFNFNSVDEMAIEEVADDDEDCDMIFCIGDKDVRCRRNDMASLSRPFKTMLYGGFLESKRERINFTQNGFSAEAMRAAEVFSRTKRVSQFEPKVVLELLSLANRYCCEEMKAACDAHLASLVFDMEDSGLLIEYGLEETANLLVAACLQLFLRELPGSMQCSSIMKIFCTPEGRDRLAAARHASFVLYYFLSQIAMEEDMRSNMTVMLLERLVECAKDGWQKQLAFHQLGVVMLERKEYKDAQHWFEAAVEAGHVYSLVGVARAKYKRGHTYSTYKIMNSLISDYKPVGWMYQERSLYCVGKEKMMDLMAATELDPTLSGTFVTFVATKGKYVNSFILKNSGTFVTFFSTKKPL